MMRENYKGNKMKREEVKRKKKEAKRLKLLNRHEENNPKPAVNETEAGETAQTWRKIAGAQS